MTTSERIRGKEAEERRHNSIKEYFRQYTVVPENSIIRHLEQVNNHVPLAAVADQVTCKVTNEPIIKWAASFLD